MQVKRSKEFSKTPGDSSESGKAFVQAIVCFNIFRDFSFCLLIFSECGPAKPTFGFPSQKLGKD